MGLISKEVEVVLQGTNIKYYEELGYEIPRKRNKYGQVTIARGTKIKVKIEHLPLNSSCLVEICCDNCKEISTKKYSVYTKCSQEDGRYYCKKCAMKLYGASNRVKSALKNSKSIAQWIIDNNLDINEYWDFEKNTVDPWNITFSSKIKCWFICQEKDYHGSYEMACNDFGNGHRCPYCSNHKVHPKDSLGQYIIDNFGKEFFNKVWSIKNTIDAFTIKPNSVIECWWNCPDGKHEPYQRKCNHSCIRDFRCPKCYDRTGENSPCWNPDLTQEERVYGRKIDGYNDFVKNVFKRDNYTCKCCGNKNGGNLNAHHLNSYSDFKEQRTDINNGITLCELCHKEFHKAYGYKHNTEEQFNEWITDKIKNLKED